MDMLSIEGPERCAKKIVCSALQGSAHVIICHVSCARMDVVLRNRFDAGSLTSLLFRLGENFESRRKSRARTWKGCILGAGDVANAMRAGGICGCGTCFAAHVCGRRRSTLLQWQGGKFENR